MPAFSGQPLSHIFFSAPAVEVAPWLLGKTLICATDQGEVAGMIVEVEAYHGADPASHSFRGRSQRNNVMFGPGGYAYVYFTYGMHWCLNVVCGQEGQGEAVLVRALQPLEGIPIMSVRRGQTVLTQLCSGPAKLTQAFAITGEHNGVDLTKPPLYIATADEVQPGEIQLSRRVGVSAAQDAPLRFSLRGNSYVSHRNLL